MNRFHTYQFIAKSLSLTCNPELKQEVCDEIISGKVNWNKFFKIASNHLVLQTLFSIYATHGISGNLPVDVHAELMKIYDLNLERNKRLLKQASEINAILRKNGIVPVFLKGTGHLMNNLYRDPAERILADIDLLVPRDQLMFAVESLRTTGYQATEELTPDKEHIYKKHHPRLFKEGEAGYVEIHWEAVRPKYAKHFKAETILAAAQPSVLYPSCKTLSAKDNIIHHFIHSQLEHKGNAFASVYLRNIYDLMLLHKMTNAEDVLKEFGFYKRQSSAYLLLAEKVFRIQMVSGKKSFTSRIYILRHKLNGRMITFSLLLQLLQRFSVSYVQKPLLVFSNKEVRKAMKANLSDINWYKQHFRSYRRIFGKK